MQAAQRPRGFIDRSLKGKGGRGGNTPTGSAIVEEDSQDEGNEEEMKDIEEKVLHNVKSLKETRLISS
jgi:hypothetical protein